MTCASTARATLAGIALLLPAVAAAQSAATPVRPPSSAPPEPGSVDAYGGTSRLLGRRLFVDAPGGARALRLEIPEPVLEPAGLEPWRLLRRDAGRIEFWSERSLWQTDGTRAGTEWLADAGGWWLFGRAAGGDLAVGRDDASCALLRPRGRRLEPLFRFATGDHFPFVASTANGAWFGATMSLDGSGPAALYWRGPTAEIVEGPTVDAFVNLGTLPSGATIGVWNGGVHRVDGTDITPLSVGLGSGRIGVRTTADRLWALGSQRVVSTDGTVAGTLSFDTPVEAEWFGLQPVGDEHVAIQVDGDVRLFDRAGRVIAEIEAARARAEVGGDLVAVAEVDDTEVRLVRVDPVTGDRAELRLSHDRFRTLQVVPDPDVDRDLLWVLHHPPGAPGQIRAFGPTWNEVVAPVPLAPPFAEDVQRVPLAATDDGAVVVREDGPNASLDVFDTATRTRLFAGGDLEFVASDGAAHYFTRLDPDAALLRWTRAGGEEVIFRPPRGSVFSLVTPGVGGRPRFSAGEVGCSREPCFTTYQALADGRVVSVLDDIGAPADAKLAVGTRWWVAWEDAEGARVVNWDPATSATVTVWTGAELPEGSLVVPAEGDVRPWIVDLLEPDRLRFVRLDEREPLPETDVEIELEGPLLFPWFQVAGRQVSAFVANGRLWQFRAGGLNPVPGVALTRFIGLPVWTSAGLFSAVYFEPDGDEAPPGLELAVIRDGRAELVRDIWPGPAGANPRGLHALPDGSAVVFHAETPDHGRELWVSDGTARGTRLVCDFVPGPESGIPNGSLVSITASAAGVYVPAFVEGEGTEVVFVPMDVVRGERPCREDDASPPPTDGGAGQDGSPSSLQPAGDPGCGCSTTRAARGLGASAAPWLAVLAVGLGRSKRRKRAARR